MKKLMMAAVALICMTMMSVSLTACGGDDDSSKPKDQIEYFVEGSLGYRIPDKTQAHGTVYSLVLCKIIVISSKK